MLSCNKFRKLQAQSKIPPAVWPQHQLNKIFKLHPHHCLLLYLPNPQPLCQSRVQIRSPAVPHCKTTACCSGCKPDDVMGRDNVNNRGGGLWVWQFWMRCFHSNSAPLPSCGNRRVLHTFKPWDMPTQIYAITPLCLSGLPLSHPVLSFVLISSLTLTTRNYPNTEACLQIYKLELKIRLCVTKNTA